MGARYTDPAQTRGSFDLASGGTYFGALPPEAGDVLAEYQAWIAAGNTPDPFAEPPVDLLAYAENKRWEREVGGMVVGGMTILTDDRSKLLINGAYNAAKEDPNFETVWGGDYPLNAAQIVAVGKALADHVNACWMIYTTVKAGIVSDPPTVTTTAQIDDAFAA